jgi:hypothetical protein
LSLSFLFVYPLFGGLTLSFPPSERLRVPNHNTHKFGILGILGILEQNVFARVANVPFFKPIDTTTADENI